MAKTRKLRGVLTGGLSDIEAAYAILKKGIQDSDPNWLVDVYETRPFGDRGPLHKINFGFELRSEA
jgi:hypothetical protein